MLDQQRRMKEKSMKSSGQRQRVGMRVEYDLDYSKAVRGRYYRQLVKEGSSVVVLDPDVAQQFRTSAAVNKALRALLKDSPPARRSGARSAVPSRSKAPPRTR